jgi:ABC-type Fe3+-hydroxamate transport system substrate-binding protein
MNKQRALLGLMTAIVVVIAACSSATPGASAPSSASADPTSPTTQTSDGGEVTVVADWAGPAAGAVFELTLDTHSVDLDALDLADATLKNDRGETLVARPWPAPKGGHHREGALTFDGESTAFLSGANWVELKIIGVGDLPERTLRWEIRS